MKTYLIMECYFFNTPFMSMLNKSLYCLHVHPLI